MSFKQLLDSFSTDRVYIYICIPRPKQKDDFPLPLIEDVLRVREVVAMNGNIGSTTASAILVLLSCKSGAPATAYDEGKASNRALPATEKA